MNTIQSRFSLLDKPLQLLTQYRDFTCFWLGQSLSEIGNRLTGFGLGIWVYQNTHAVAQFSLVLFFTTLPGVLLTPFVGVLVDRWNRQRIILISDIAAAIVTLALALLLAGDNLKIWHTYVCAFFTSVCGAFQMTAKGAALPMLVPHSQIGRANGLIQLSSATSLIAAPALAGLLMAYIHLDGLLWIDFGTYFVAFFTLVLIQIPQPDLTSQTSKVKHSIIDEFRYSWDKISSSMFLSLLLVFMMFHFFVNGMTNVLINPLILSFSSEATFGVIMSLGGVGMVVGSIAMSLWGGATKLITTLVGFSALNGVALVIIGIKPSTTLIGLGVFLSFLSIPIVMGINRTIWQTSIPATFHGRVLGKVGMVTGLAVTFGNLSASPLADNILEPMLSVDGVLANSLGRVIETGHGRGIGFLLILEGILILVVSASFYYYFHHVQHPDSELVTVVKKEKFQTLESLAKSSHQREELKT